MRAKRIRRKSFVEGVYEVLGLFEVGKIRKVRCLCGGVYNQCFLVETDTGRYTLKKFTEANDKELGVITKALISLQNSTKLSVPILMKNGGAYYVKDGFYYVLFLFLAGDSGRVGELNCFKSKNVGVNMAHLHSVKQELDLLPHLKVGLRAAITHFLNHEINTLHEIRHDPFLEYLRSKINFVGLLTSRKDVSWGIVHGDLCPANIVFNGDAVAGFIDWEFLCHAPCLLDIGVFVTQCCTLNSWTSDQFTFDEELAKRFLDGYQSVKQLTQVEKTLLCDYFCLGALTFAFLCFRIHFVCKNEKLRGRHRLWWNVANYFATKSWPSSFLDSY